ncbi:hypothetical protein LCGC14_1845560 [marine sediment metagenome]|uniref:Uncharacterized protein n=1 Tax=marine sediment metagenome TaxID=412755 RepID=A0A0F9IRI6_9ZZZZ
MIRHRETGQFLSPNCDDPNCGGILVADTRPGISHDYSIWRCDGLTYEVDGGPLMECKREFPRSDSATGARDGD